MRTWEEQQKHEAKTAKRIRMEWLRELAALEIGVTDAANQVGIHPAALSKHFIKHGITTTTAKRYQFREESKPVTIQDQQKAALKTQWDANTKRLISHGYKPAAARDEAFRMLQLNVSQGALQ